MSDFSDRLDAAVNAIVEDEVRSRLTQAPASPQTDDNVRPVRLWLSNGFASGTIHRVAQVDGSDIWATAFHVTNGTELADQLAEYGQCFTLRRRFSPDKPDIHFFAQDAEAMFAFKDACPSPEEAAARFGFPAGSFYNENPNAAYTAILSGYPHGSVDGAAQRREGVPFYYEAIDELLWFYTRAPVVGGMSGGKVADIADGSRSHGVLVATSHLSRQDYALVQLFHNQMTLEAA